MSQNIKSVVITGALGFIGSHTAKEFKQAGYHVIGIDWQKNSTSLAVHYIDELLVDDFVDIVGDAIREPGVGCLVHCAATSLVGPSLSDPGLYYNNNVAKTNLMLEKFKSIGFKGTIIFSSSAATYGTINANPISESALQYPINPYGQSKLMCEQIIHDHCKAHGLKGVVLRYFNAAGCDPEGILGHVHNDSHLIPRILSAYQQGQQFTLYGNTYDTRDGTCVRDYVHVTDIASAHLMAAELPINAGSFVTYNIGTGHGFSNREILDSCSKAVGSTINYSIGVRRAGDPDELVASNKKILRETNWRPKYSDIETIVKTAWKWQQKLKT